MGLRIRSIQFRAGPTANVTGLTVDVGSVVVLVGPNGSGKSAALREIEIWCRGTDSPKNVIASIDAEIPTTVEEAEGFLRELAVPPPANQPVNEATFYVGGFESGQAAQFTTAQVEARVLPELVSGQRMDIARHYLIRFFTLRLDGRTRFALADAREWRDFLAAPTNHLVKLFQDDGLRAQVRALTAAAFGRYFVIDPTQQGTLRMRMSAREPRSKNEEQSFDADARAFHSAAPLVTELSDGVQAFVGLVAAVLALPHRIMLIDEPEAFLHPPLARRLGATLVRIAQQRQASLLVATHSAEFLRGCLEGADAPAVVRLTYESGAATARVLEPAEVRRLLRNPLLRSTGALAATFHRAAVIAEADADRAFYEEINRRLVESGEQRGIDEAVFLNVQNKQTLWQVVEPLRTLGIPAAAVADADYLSDTGANWSNLLRACRVPPSEQTRLAALRDQVIVALGGPAQAIDSLPQSGVRSLTGQDLVPATALVTGLAIYGVFVVPHGGLESWLSALGVTGKAQWLPRVFERMGDTVGQAGYLAPANGDVWSFIDGIAAWVKDPNRLGL